MEKCHLSRRGVRYQQCFIGRLPTTEGGVLRQFHIQPARDVLRRRWTRAGLAYRRSRQDADAVVRPGRVGRLGVRPTLRDQRRANDCAGFRAEFGERDHVGSCATMASTVSAARVPPPCWMFQEMSFTGRSGTQHHFRRLSCSFIVVVKIGLCLPSIGADLGSPSASQFYLQQSNFIITGQSYRA
jgi:hypothetical protein